MPKAPVVSEAAKVTAMLGEVMAADLPATTEVPRMAHAIHMAHMAHAIHMAHVAHVPVAPMRSRVCGERYGEGRHQR